MSRYPEFHTPEGIARRLAEGRGQGRGPTYKPYFTRFDVRSRGERRETYCALCERSIHLLSRLEYHLYLIAQDDPEVKDIREQFPCPREETERIADELGIRHPRYWKTGCNVVMTTDLVLTKRNASGAEITEAWSGKYTDSLRSWRTREKQLLEATWHAEKGHRWFLKTENDTPPIYVSNLAWLQPLRRNDAMLGYPDDLCAKVDSVIRKRLPTSQEPLWRLAVDCDHTLGFGDRPVSLYACRRLLATRQWRADLRSWNRATDPLRLTT